MTSPSGSPSLLNKLPLTGSSIKVVAASSEAIGGALLCGPSGGTTVSVEVIVVVTLLAIVSISTATPVEEATLLRAML